MDKNLLIKRLKKAGTRIKAGQDVEVGLFEPDDALGVSLCYFEIYGNGFPIDHVYDPKEVVRRNATDDQYTVVARTPKKEIVGLAGIFRHAPNPGVYEIGQLMLQKAFRSGRISADIVQQAIAQSLALNLPVIFCESVCNHPVSQRLAFEQGLNATGLELECMPSTAYEKERSGRRNISLLMSFDVRRDTKHKVHLPQAYAGFITKMYDDFGLVRETVEGSDFTGTTKSDEFLLPKEGFARITIQRAGTDFQDIIEKAESNAGKNGLVQVYINLGDKTAPKAIDHLRDTGYFLGGLLPLWFGTDGLIMQKLPQPPAWDELHLHGLAAKNLAAYIRRDHERMKTDQ